MPEIGVKKCKSQDALILVLPDKVDVKKVEELKEELKKLGVEIIPIELKRYKRKETTNYRLKFENPEQNPYQKIPLSELKEELIRLIEVVFIRDQLQTN